MNHPQDKSAEISKLEALNEELENYFRNTIIPQLFVDENLLLRKFTPPAMKQFDLSNSDLGKPISEICHHIRFPTFMENIKEVMERGIDLEKEIQTTDFRWFQMNILPYKIFKENRTNGVIITFVNITDRIRNLKEIEKLNADHETFIYSVSHDLKGPVSNLEGLSATLMEISENAGSEYKAVAEMVSVSVHNLKNIIAELTDVTRTRNNFTKKAERVSIENIIEEVQLTLRDRINSTGAKITTQIMVSEFIFIRKNFRSIVYNLLSNAIKYRAENRIPEIFIKTERTEDFIVLTVEDNGIGIAENHTKNIFSQFSRISDNVEGTGVGLYIVSKMVDNSGGRIELESTVDKGTTFRIYFKSHVF